jgi:hypothetical protein
MSRQEMTKAISEIVGNSRLQRGLEQARPYLLEVSDRLQEPILGVIAGNHSLAFMFLIVTPSKIIMVGEAGSIDVWRYADVQHVEFLVGKKKLFGGYENSYFRVIESGSASTFQIYGEPEYVSRVGAGAESAFRNVKLSNI